MNELYHDIEVERYADRHPEIFKHQSDRWRRVAQRFLSSRPLSVWLLDVGCGTGFVPLQIGRYLGRQDRLICSDISAKMLDQCQTNLAGRFDCQQEYLKLTGGKIDLPDHALFYITMNSVLHHIPNLREFLLEISRLLKTDGYLLIGHEPYRPFYDHFFLSLNYRLVLNLTHPRRLGGRLARRMGARSLLARYSKAMSADIRGQALLTAEINEVLLSERLIQDPLTDGQIAEIVDIHSPTAGHGRAGDSPNLLNLVIDHLTDFEIVHLETYRHLAKVSHQNRCTIAYDRLLAHLWPDTGSTFFAVLRKHR